MDECTVSALNVKVNVRRVIITEVKDQRSSRLVVVFLSFFSEKIPFPVQKKKKKELGTMFTRSWQMHQAKS